jgi:hypothetical protein
LPECNQGRKVHRAVGVLWKSCTACSSAEMDLCLPSRANWYNSQHPSITVHICRIFEVGSALKQPEVLQHGAILHQDSAKPHHHRDVQNLAR